MKNLNIKPYRISKVNKEVIVSDKEKTERRKLKHERSNS